MMKMKIKAVEEDMKKTTKMMVTLLKLVMKIMAGMKMIGVRGRRGRRRSSTWK